MKRALIALFLPFIFQACSSECHQWQYQKINTTCNQFDFSKLTLYPECEIKGLELEVSRTTDSGIRMYANVYTMHIPQLPEYPGKALVIVSLPEQEISFNVLADVLEGSQRLLFPDDVADYIVECLMNEVPLTIQVGRYSSDIITAGFVKGYLQLQQWP